MSDSHQDSLLPPSHSGARPQAQVRAQVGGEGEQDGRLRHHQEARRHGVCHEED